MGVGIAGAGRVAALSVPSSHRRSALKGDSAWELEVLGGGGVGMTPLDAEARQQWLLWINR